MGAISSTPIHKHFRLPAFGREEGAMSFFKFTVVDLIRIIIGLTGLYLTWLQVTGGGAAGH
jgi:hypothetical protein